jgi:hypothetical protein
MQSIEEAMSLPLASLSLPRSEIVTYAKNLHLEEDCCRRILDLL